MRRALRIAILSLSCGLLTTWLTAWAAVISVRITSTTGFCTDNYQTPQWLMTIQPSRRATIVWSKPIDHSDPPFTPTLNMSPLSPKWSPGEPLSLTARTAPSWSRPHRVEMFDFLSNQGPLADRPWQLHEVASGWPFHCLRGAWSESPGIDTFQVLFNRQYPSFALPSPPQVQTTIRGIAIPARFAADSPLLPTVPIWPAFLVNVAIHSAAFAALFAATLALTASFRRWRSKFNHLCPTCRYDRSGLAADATCPECGTSSSVTHNPA